MENSDLINRIQALEQWKADRERQQLVFPLDVVSQKILGNYTMQINGSVSTAGGANGRTFTTYTGQQGQIKFLVEPNPYITYTVDTSTDKLTATDGNFQDHDWVNVISSGTPPTPLDTVTRYYVVSSASGGRVFKLSLTDGGATINITDLGDGIQYIYLAQF